LWLMREMNKFSVGWSGWQMKVFTNESSRGASKQPMGCAIQADSDDDSEESD